ncbi:sensor histidine kinase [Haloferula rosea]|uniref:histidine kinase n=1 Tax=Haloferula rosea TaxID=490093 RepID=A0A934R9K6_9BACT|nr:HAMP domain-containing sensor histidine kinase [Haloferula rosea]MBK1826897.1 HAMP domain-containing histidine kinase [Haloferula rosea]
MSDFFSKLLDTSDFPDRWNCGNWDTFHGWLHIGSDLAIWAAYGAIPIALVSYGWKKRGELRFGPVLFLFAAFILSCGTTHLIEAIIFYEPVYRLSGLVKLITAVVSWATVFAVVGLLPSALKLPGLKAANERLTEELEKRREAEQRLAAANDELQTFTSMVTHDLRNPTGSALLMAEVSLESLSRNNVEQLRDQLEVVVSSLKQVEHTLSELNQQSHELDGIEMKERVDLNEIVQRSQTGLSSTIAASGAVIKVGELPTIEGRSTMLVHLFTNLIENAIKYRTEDLPVVEIESIDTDQGSSIHVKDNGRGIDPDDLGRIFEPKYRGNNIEDEAGTGLGLAYCQRIMLSHQGTIEAASDPDGGTLFTLKFPLPENVSPPPTGDNASPTS